MFDSVLERNVPKRQFGRGAILSFAIHALLFLLVAYLSSRPAKAIEKELRAVTFLATPPPPPPPPPPPAGGAQKKPKVETKTVVKKQDTLVESKAKPDPVENKPAAKDDPAGQEGGVEGGVAGGVVGGVVGGVLGGQLGNALNQNQAIPFGAGMERPKLLSNPPPTLTPEAKAANIQGLAIVKCVINLDGSLSNCKLVKGLQFLDKAILEAVSRWKYTPVTFQGRPVSVEYVIQVRVTQ